MIDIADRAGPMFRQPEQDWQEGDRVSAPFSVRHHAGAAAARVAYLTNVYPKVSHSFIRTEIAALERQGFAVSRFTVRRTDQALPGPEDRAEAERTTVLLDDRIGLMAAPFAYLLVRPLTLLKTLKCAWTAAGPGNRLRACAYLAEAALLSRRLERAGVHHIHAHFGTNPASVARLAARLAGMTYSFTVHGPDEFDAPLGVDLPGKIAEAAFVAGVSSFGRGQLMRWSAPEHWDRLHVVRCAPEPAFLCGSEPPDGIEGIDGPPLRAATRFLCVARLSAQKGLPLLVSAFARLCDHGGWRHDVTLDIIGDGEDRAAIAAQIAALGLQKRVRLLGWASPEAIRRALIQARVFVLPSFAEGLPVVLMEAMALRRPVIATAIAGIPELVDPAVGWLVPSGSTQALADAMEAALDAPEAQLRAMGEEARRRVLERHEADRCAADLAALLAPFAGSYSGACSGTR